MKNLFLNNKHDSYHKILKLILEKQRISRKEIADELDLAWGTVSNNVNLMIDQKLIKEESPIINGVGRSTCYLIPNNELYASIGVDINTIGLSASIVLLNGETKYFTMMPVEKLTQEEIIDKIIQIIDRAFEFIRGKYEVITIGLSCQGDVYSNRELYSDMPFVDNWKPINLVKLIEENYQIQAYQSHDMECLLLDLTFRYPGDKNLIVSRVVDGIGFGIIKDGDVLNEKISLDYGHEIVVRNGLPCQCGQRGCLEAYSSIKGITKRLGISENELFSNYKNYEDILNDAIEKFSLSIYNIASIYNIKNVVICGKLFAQIPHLFSKLERELYLMEKRKNFDVNLTFLTDLSPSFGAAIFALRKLFE